MKRTVNEKAMAETDGNVEFWSCDARVERYTHQDKWEAISDFLVDYANCVPFPIKVYGGARMKADATGDCILEQLFEHYEEDFGDPDAFYDAEMTDNMRVAANHLAEVFNREYKPWACNHVVTEEYTKEEVEKELKMVIDTVEDEDAD